MKMVLLDRAFTNEEIAIADPADLRNVSKSVWNQVLNHCHAKDLRLYHITLDTLNGIELLKATTRLSLEWAPKIYTIDPVFKMFQLEYLCVNDFAKLRNITGIERLKSLIELKLTGNLGSMTNKLSIESLAPVAELKNLKVFSLYNAKLDDDDITILASCSKLRELYLANQFERKQFAYLAKKLNSQLITPIISNIKSTILCEKCGQFKYMFIGRRMPFLCKDCDSKRFNKLENDFNELVGKA